MTLAWRALSQAAQAASPDTLERAHFRHLVGVIQGDITPYASWYRQGELMETALLELRQDLRALGFERTTNTPEPEDHLAALCEVMAMLVTDAAKPRQASFFFTILRPGRPIAGVIWPGWIVRFMRP
ncbi:TorD/DmsD family molecular chaperone [Vreelandella azerica]|uniref:TorD/DmsD family molecular chaperone n=1 Tax=Vreelandella azerica TaxID=2732867 RepID=UPI001F1F673B|nr:molecular chaperone TorD family protein [Halomonas azerica]